MGRLLFVLFLLLPLVEIALFIVIGNAIGLWPTLLGVLLSAVIGALVLRLQGRALVPNLRAAAAQGTLPGRTIADAMMVGIAGVLLLLPGYFTDAIGLLLLLPPVRTLLYAALGARMTVVRTTDTRPPGPTQPSGPRVIDLDDSDWRQR